MTYVRSKLRRRPILLALVLALVIGAVGAVFTVSQVAASGSESECTAQVVDDGSNDGETADDAQACSPEQIGTDADSANEDSN
jgi:hypothetical protein